MSDIKLFSIQNSNTITELTSSAAKLEKDLQALIESQMETFLGVRFLATEYSTGKTHKGRIDSLGLDENGCPVIIEYKRNSNENVINQGLFYLDWLLDHKAEFQLLVMEQFGVEAAKDIEWSGTRLICIASDFNKYDEHAVQQINRNIELMRYRYFGEELLLLELVNAQSAVQQAVSTSYTKKAAMSSVISSDSSEQKLKPVAKDKTQDERLAEAPAELKELFERVCQFAIELGDEVQRKDLKLYTAFKRIKNFASIIVLAVSTDAHLKIVLKLPGERAENDGFTRDVSNIGHWGSGNFEVTVRNAEDFEKAKALIVESYETN